MDLEEKLCALVAAHPRGVELPEIVDKLFPHLQSHNGRYRAVQRSEVRNVIGRLRQDGRLSTERRGDRLVVIPR